MCTLFRTHYMLDFVQTHNSISLTRFTNVKSLIATAPVLQTKTRSMDLSSGRMAPPSHVTILTRDAHAHCGPGERKTSISLICYTLRQW